MEKKVSFDNGYNISKLIHNLEETGSEINREGDSILVSLYTPRLIFSSWGTIFLLRSIKILIRDNEIFLNFKLNWTLLVFTFILSLVASIHHYGNGFDFQKVPLESLLTPPIMINLLMIFCIWLIRIQFLRAVKKSSN